MSVEYVMDLAQRTMMAGLKISAPILAFGMAIGLIVSILQAATQIQEASLSFIPKLLGMSLAVVFFGPWMLDQLMSFTIVLIQSTAQVGG